MTVKHRRYIRNFLLDRRLQLRYTLVIVLTSALLTAGLGYFWYDETRTTSRILEVQALASMSDQDVKTVEQDLAHHDHKRLVILVVFGATLALVLAGFGIIFTHKIAGPLYKVQRHFRDIREGQLPEIYDLRKGDQLLDFWLDFKQMYAALRDQARGDADLLDDVLQAAAKQLPQAAVSAQQRPGASGSVDPAGAVDELSGQLDQLRALRDRKRAALG